MINSFPPFALAFLVTGAVTLLAALGRAGLARIGLPDAIGYMVFVVLGTCLPTPRLRATSYGKIPKGDGNDR